MKAARPLLSLFGLAQARSQTAWRVLDATCLLSDNNMARHAMPISEIHRAHSHAHLASLLLL